MAKGLQNTTKRSKNARSLSVGNRKLSSQFRLCLTKMSFVLAASIFPKYACLDSHSCCGPHSEQLRTGTLFGMISKPESAAERSSFGLFRWLVVHSGGVARPLAAPPQRVPLSAVELVAARASPSPMKCASSFRYSTGNNRREVDAGRLHGTR